MGLYLHKETRNKKVINFLSDLGRSISNKRVLKIENSLANAIVEKITTNGGVFVSSNLELGKKLHFAIDNIDFKNDTADGKSEFHGTTLVVFRSKPIQQRNLIKLSSCTSLKHTPPVPKETFPKPNPLNESFPTYGPEECSLVDLSGYCNLDRLWSFCQVAKDKDVCPLPTWSAFNSLITPVPNINICHLYAGIPTDFSNLYHSLKLAQGINVAVSGGGKTIVTLDLQLYSKCMQMRENEEIKKNFIFRLGEIHIVFAFLKVIGKYIQGSSIDQVLIEAGIYGMTTLGQILEGEHMKRAIEAHMVIYLSLWKIYLEQFFQKHPEASQPLREIISSLLQINLEEVKMDHVKASVTALKSDGILGAFQNFDQNLEQEARFLRNYILMYKILLHFVCANCKGDW